MKILGNKIKDLVAIQSSIKRMAHQVYENNLNENKIIIVGISKKGYVLGQHIGAILKTISNIEITLVKLEIDKNNPLKNIKCDPPLKTLENKSIVIVDDVLNTGSTLIYAVSYFLKIPVNQINTAVMVNRNHKKFPVKADFKGISLSTSINEHISVVLEGTEAGIYLS